MNKLSKEQELFICDKIKQSIDENISKVRNFYLKIVGGLGVVILLETGALIWSLAIGASENNHQNKAINTLSTTVNSYIKSNDELVKSLVKTTIENAKDIEDNEDRLDRAGH